MGLLSKMLASCRQTLHRSSHARMARLNHVKLLSWAPSEFQTPKNNTTKMRDREFHHGGCLCQQPVSVQRHKKNVMRKFKDLPNLHEKSKLSLAKAGLTRMTEIQSKTWHHGVQGKDVIARARTGTGKTMAFLLPSIERILHDQPSLSDESKISILVLSPNRELATQTQEQVKLLARCHDGSVSSVLMIGGTNAKHDMDKLTQQGLPTVLVATPGRLLSHLKDSHIGDAPFSTCLDSLRILVIDEADTMLAMGFRESLTEILSYCPPPEQRQTMLFSATLEDATDLARRATKPDYVLVDCVAASEETDSIEQSAIPVEVNQSYVLVPESRLFSSPIEILAQLVNPAKRRERKKSQRNNMQRKILAFFPTINQVRLYESILNNRLGRRVFAIHSEMDQSARRSVRNLFQHSHNAILLTTDVSARGLDYEGITHVVQFGMPYDKENYIHRLGRTARAGKSGEGLLVLTPLELDFLEATLEGLEVKHNAAVQSVLENPMERNLEDMLAQTAAEVRDGNDRELRKLVDEACRTMFAYYHSKKAVLQSSCKQCKQLGTTVEDNLIKMTNAFLLQAGVTSRTRMGGTTGGTFKQQAWSPGDGFDVGRTITRRVQKPR